MRNSPVVGAVVLAVVVHSWDTGRKAERDG